MHGYRGGQILIGADLPILSITDLVNEFYRFMFLVHSFSIQNYLGYSAMTRDSRLHALILVTDRLNSSRFKKARHTECKKKEQSKL